VSQESKGKPGVHGCESRGKPGVHGCESRVGSRESWGESGVGSLEVSPGGSRESPGQSRAHEGEGGSPRASREHARTNRESRDKSGVMSPGASRESGEGAAVEQKVGTFCLPGFVEDRGQICFSRGNLLCIC
jgi:hypothetical protein